MMGKNLKFDTTFNETDGSRLLSEKEKRQILYDFNDTEKAYPEEKTIHQLFEEQVERTPDNIAVVEPRGRHSITYRLLNRKADQLAHVLRTRGAAPDTIVGIMVERSIDMVVGLLGILKSGGCYLCIDPAYPEVRKRLMIEESGVNVLLTPGDLDDPDNYPGEVSHLEHLNRPGDLLYVIYTSGSTGTPKGVLVNHGGFVNLVYVHRSVFGEEPESRFSQVASVSFDAMAFEIWPCLSSGAALCIADDDVRMAPGKLREWLIENSITISFQPTMMAEYLLKGEWPESGAALKALRAAGDRLKQFPCRDYPFTLYNLYGPTEDTVWTTWAEVEVKVDGADGKYPPIGKPVGNHKVFIVGRGSDLMLQPVGVAGELCISGVGLARGYLNRPELTAETFMSAPASSSSSSWGLRLAACGCRLYKTGDLACWLPDGSIEFLGRLDHQVKIRGFRIELGEIENYLLRHDAVEEAVVDVGEAGDGEKYLCAYIVPAAEMDVSTLRQYLHLKLPGYMVPSYFVMLEELPVTSSGKVDRSALPAPALSPAAVYAAPAGETEKKLVTIWSEVLKIDEDVIGIDNNFFDLGGHSLKGTLMTAKIHQAFHVRISLADVFKRPTVRAVSRYINDRHRDEYISIEKVEERDYYVLSSAQKRLYILDRMVLGSTNYNLPVVFQLDGEPDRVRLEDAFFNMINRHDSFRTSFMMPGEEPVQVIHDPGEVEFEMEYYGAQHEEHCPGIMKSFVRPFDLSRAPLIRAGLVKILKKNYLLMVDMHHIISDGMSFQVFKKELAAFYDSNELPCLRIQYKDYAGRQRRESRSEKIREQEAYWLREFEGEIPVLNLPGDYARPAIQGFEGDYVDFEIGKGEVSALNALARETGTTLFMVLLAIFKVLMAKLSGQEDIVVGSPAAGRRHADLENIIGMFVNTLAIRSQPLGRKTFNEFLREINRKTLDAFENQEYQFEELVEQVMVTRDTGRNPLFDVMFALQNMDREDLAVSSLNIGLRQYHFDAARFDLTLFTEEEAGGLSFSLEYGKRLFKRETGERFVRYFKRIVSVILKSPGKKISGIEIITAEEKRQILYDFNDTETAYPGDKTIHRLFEEQVEKTPEKISVVFQDKHLTYNELNKKSNQLARVLRGNGVQPDAIVGMMVDRSLEMPIGILGILKADGAYLPLDPGYPQERKKFMLNDCGSRILLTRKSDPAHVNFTGMVFDIEDEEVFSGQLTGNLDHGGGAGNLVYVIYTSGTTGKPKGTLTMHYNVIRVVRDTNYIDLTGDDRVLQLSNYAFDGSTFDIYGALLNGAALVMLRQEDIVGGDILVNLIEREGISVFFVTTALFNTLVDIGIESFDGIRSVLFGGERVSVDHSRRAWERVGKDKIIHMYGPTETTVYATYYFIDEIGEDWDTIPIGKPLANTTAYILDKYAKPQPPGVPGEIYIGGDGLARGYLNQPELTSEKFIPNPFKERELLYKTGDLAIWDVDGNITFSGRIDQQLKIRGFRVELGEIESRLTAYGGVREAVVRAVPAAGGADKQLCAYIVREEEVGLDMDGLREYLSLELPDYMIPSFFVQLEKIPLTPNGKIDSKALPLPEINPAGVSYAAPENKMQQNLVRIWSGALSLDIEMIGIDDNFFELGGHSLKGTVVITKIHKEFDVRISLSEMFRLSTIRRLSAYIEEAAEDRYISIVNVEEKEYYDLSYAQRRLWILCQFEEDSSAYNIPAVFVVSGEFDTGAYARAIQALVNRHESLRTVFIPVNGEPKQRVVNLPGYRVEHIDLCSAGLDQKAREQKAREIFRSAANYVFDLEQGPLCLFETVRLEDKKYLVIISIHHIVSDGWSQGIIFNEIFTLYNTFSRGKENPDPLTPLNLRYKDYTRWHNKLIAEDHFKESETYWLEKFKDKPNGIELPLDHHRQPIQTFNGNRLFFCIDKVKTPGLQGICKEENVTLFMGLLSLCTIFLYKYTGQRDIMIGAPIAGRKRTELNTLVGFFVNTLVYRMRVNPHEGFRQLLQRMKKETLDCYEYQDYPFDLLIDRLELDRDLSQSPLFNVMLAHNNSDTLDSRLRMEGVSVSDYPYRGDFNMSKFDLIFFMDEIGGHIDVFLEYNSDLFEAGTIGRMVKNFQVLLDNVVEDPGVFTAELNYLHKEEYERVVRDFNRTSHPFPGLSIQELFERQVRHSPDKTAVVDVNGTNFITYDRLNKRANQLARYLREEYAAGPGDVIGISVDRSLEMIIAVLGVIKSGAGYVAIDPNYPEERVLHMLSDSRAGLLIVDEMRPELFGDYRGKMLNIHRDWKNINSKPNQNPGVLNQPANILYVIYTSGSTGVPNGAMLSHGILTNLVQWQSENSSIDASLRCLQFTSVNFCVSFQEIMITLIAGGELHLIGDIERQDVDYLMDFLNSHRIELLYLPFSYLNFLFNESGRFGELYKHYLQHIVTAGEQLKITSGLRKFLARNRGIRLHNHYGSSEMHVVTSYTLDAASMDKTPIPPAGKPVANTKIYILDDYFHPVPIGVWGELFVEGHSEVLGYINNTGLTNQKLVDHPVLSVDHKRLYRSGDLGRWLEDGNIELKGRKDTQIKIRGFRVELGEIESKILLMETVRDCVVVVKEDKGGQKHLVAYITGKGNHVEPLEIKRNVAGFLPQYMIPRVVVLDRLPLMPNGKVDRDNLPEPGNLVDEEYTAPRNKIERTLAGIWSALLGIEEGRLGVHANFFDVGGHSMKATVMVSEIHKAFNVKVPLTEIFRGPTISEIAVCINGASGDKYTSVETTEKKEYYALSPAQKGLFIIQKLDNRNIAYNLPRVLLLEGRLDVRKLEETFQELVNRHESLRTSFITVNDEPVQTIHDRVEFAIQYDVVGVGVEDNVEEISGGFVRPFDLSRAPLLRVGLAKIREEQYIFMVDMHHIITDGVSYTIFVEELTALYLGEELPALKLHYKDYSQWQKRVREKEINDLKKQERFWLKEFEKGIPLLEVAADYERPGVLSFAGSHLIFEIGKKETGVLRKFIKEQDVTLFMILLAVFYVLLAKNSGQEDIVVGIPVMGRRHADLQPIIGMFVNTLAFRNYPRGNKTFKEFLMELKERALNVFDNQDYPFEELVDKLGIKRKTNRNALFDVMFGLQNLGQRSQDLLEIKIPGLKLTPYEAGIRVSRNDLCFYAFEKSDRIDCLFEYSTRLFENETIAVMQEEYLTLLGNVLENIDCRIGDLDYKTEIERTLTEFEDIKIDF